MQEAARLIACSQAFHVLGSRQTTVTEKLQIYLLFLVNTYIQLLLAWDLNFVTNRFN